MSPGNTEDNVAAKEQYERTRDKLKAMLAGEELEDRVVELSIEQKSVPVMFSGMGMEQMDLDLQGMFEKIMPRTSNQREVTVAQARQILFDQECEALLDTEAVKSQAIEIAENMGIIFLDEIDKVTSQETRGADVSRQGV